MPDDNYLVWQVVFLSLTAPWFLAAFTWHQIIFTKNGKAAMLLRVVGGVMAVLQAALAVQYLFNSMVRIAVLQPFSPGGHF
jgi:hypothetical protein